MSDRKEHDDQQPDQGDGQGANGELIPSAASGGAVEVPAEALHEVVGDLKQLVALRSRLGVHGKKEPTVPVDRNIANGLRVVQHFLERAGIQKRLG